MLIGPAADKMTIELFRAKLKSDPAGFIAQPTLALSTCPVFTEQGIAPRHVDLRPFVLSGKEIRIVPGGLTRVALKDGSLARIDLAFSRDTPEKTYVQHRLFQQRREYAPHGR